MMVGKELSAAAHLFIGGLSVNEVLPDDILVQILCRLPRQSAMASKLVCKRWLALISTPNFISCFIKEHYRAHQQEKYLILKADNKYLFVTSQIPNSDISFGFLPSTESSPYRKSRVTILASSDDLFLCRSFRSTTAYFICNPFTKEWFDLPPPPPTSCHRGHGMVFGFTHNPYYHVQQGSEQQHVLVNSSCRFSVVRLNSPLIEESKFEIHTFSSETWEWTTSMLQHSSRPSRPSSSISRNGLLYWLCDWTGRVIIHDPYNNKVCYVVESCSLAGWFGFSVSQGSLFLFDMYPRSFRVWELEDEDHQPKWRFVTRSLVEKSSEMLESIAMPYTKFAVLGMHPNDRNKIYFSASGEVGTLNLSTGQIKRRFVPKLDRKVVFVDHEHGIRRAINTTPGLMVVFKATCWPTPVSALLHQAC